MIPVQKDFIQSKFIELIEQFAYQIDSGYIKLTIGYKMQLPTSGEVSITIDKSIPLFDHLGHSVPQKLIYEIVQQRVKLYCEQYQDAVIKAVFIRVYYDVKDSVSSLHFPKIEDLFSKILNVMESDQVCDELPDVKSLHYKKSRIPTQINSLQFKTKECRPFIVADLETLLVNDVHVPYAAGYLTVSPGENLSSCPSYRVKTFFSENHLPFYPTFEERSERMLFDFLTNLEVEAGKDSRLRTVFLHNFARFDGIIILKFYSNRTKQYKIKN